jgi:hypothetical protein
LPKMGSKESVMKSISKMPQLFLFLTRH